MHRLLPLLFIFSISLAETKTVAISYFDNTSGTKEYDPLSKGLADMLITDLSNVKSLKIVEREKLESLLKEIELGDGKFINPNTPFVSSISAIQTSSASKCINIFMVLQSCIFKFLD